MRLTTIGRRTGRAHTVIVGYFEDGLNLVTMAMNGWGDERERLWARRRQIDKNLDAYHDTR